MSSQNYFLLELSPKVEYALLALLELASQPDKKVPLTVSEITAKQPIPDRYLEQILASLRRGGLVKSHRGARGGYVLARPPWQITLLEIVTLIEGEGKEKANSDPATLEVKLIREIWQQANVACQSVFEDYTLQDLCQKREAYRQQGFMYYI